MQHKQALLALTPSVFVLRSFLLAWKGPSQVSGPFPPAFSIKLSLTTPAFMLNCFFFFNLRCLYQVYTSFAFLIASDIIQVNKQANLSWMKSCF